MRARAQKMHTRTHSNNGRIRGIYKVGMRSKTARSWLKETVIDGARRATAPPFMPQKRHRNKQNANKTAVLRQKHGKKRGARSIQSKIPQRRANQNLSRLKARNNAKIKKFKIYRLFLKKDLTKKYSMYIISA